MCSSLADAGVAIVVGPDPGEGGRIRFRAAAALSGDGAGTYHESLRRLGVQLWESANLEDPADLSLAEIHDATAAEEVFASEILGLVRPGRGIEAARSGASLPGGSGVAINPSGGLVGRGHPLGATGLAQIYEGWLQLSGNAGGRQVPDARLAATINTGGISHGEMLVAHGFMLERVAAHGPDARHDTPLGPRAGVGLG
jgi:acetyl-CoA C-acetyltransferase